MANKVGRPAKITLDFVIAVAKLVAMGMPLKYALALQDKQVKEPNYYTALERKPEFATVHARAIGEKIGEALNVMWAGDVPGLAKRCQSIQFILDRSPTFRADFGRNSDGNNVNVAVQVNGLPVEFVQKLRDATRAKLAPVKKTVGVTDNVIDVKQVT